MIANDSAVARELLFHALNSDPEIEVVSVVNDGRQAVEAACRVRPDVIAMDAQMPFLDGIEATGRIMERCPVPIVIVSASASSGTGAGGTRTFRALERGALAVVRTPPALDDPGYPAAARELIDTLKLMAEVKVVRRWHAHAKPEGGMPSPREGPSASRIGAVAIGASAGGPLALRDLLSLLPGDFPVPVLVVQHMAPGFIEAFAKWLQESSKLTIRVAVQAEPLCAGSVFLAPSGAHMGISQDGRIELSDAPAEEGLRPAVSYLFRSVMKACGPHAVAVLLTGMGRDGAAEMLALKNAGAFTIAQNEASALIYGMPGEAVKLGAASLVLPLDRIAEKLVRIATLGSAYP